VARLKEFAVSGIVPDNRELLDVIPVEYAIAGQGGIRNPIGMRGVKLEMQANVVSALLPVCMNLKEVAGALNINALKLVPTAVAAGRAVLLESLRCGNNKNNKGETRNGQRRHVLCRSNGTKVVEPR